MPNNISNWKQTIKVNDRFPTLSLDLPNWRPSLIFKILNKKCFTPPPICGSGPDQTCSDGKCYPGTISCASLGLTQTSSYACMCSDNCTATTSQFKVIWN